MLATTLSALLAAVPSLPEVHPPPDGAARQLGWGGSIECVTLAPTQKVPSGAFRVQCDSNRRECLAAPTHLLVAGVEGSEELERISTCSFGTLDRAVVEEHWPIIEATAEAPPGWYRDERGRVMQVNFDLSRRVYFGGAFAPFVRNETLTLGRGVAELGIVISFQGDDDKSVHRLHLLEGTAWLGPDARYEGSIARYDFSARRDRPPLWLTTFVGKPRRFDLDLNVTWAGELLRIEALGGKSFLSIAEADAVLDVWHTSSLESYLRVRAGPALEMDLNTKSLYLRPSVALEGDFTLDRDGFHHLTMQVLGEKLVFEPTIEGRPASPQRLKIKAGYEVILLAINDYPLTLVIDGRAIWRDDVPALRGWEVSANAGLRFSLWAPARRDALAVAGR